MQAAFLLANIDVKIQSVAFTATRYGSPVNVPGDFFAGFFKVNNPA